jgi:general secretion pathway protein D
MMRAAMVTRGYEAMALPLRFFFLFQRFTKSLLLFLCLVFSLTPAWATNEIAFTFDNIDIQTVIKKVGEFTGTTFLFDPTKVHGKITILSSQKVSAEGALQLLESALALHGYTLLWKEEGIWVMPQSRVTQAAKVTEVVPLQYAKAEEVADTLAWIAPPGVRIAPYLPTNSLIISGDAEAVKQLIGTLK